MVAPLPGADPGTRSAPESGVEVRAFARRSTPVAAAGGVEGKRPANSVGGADVVRGDASATGDAESGVDVRSTPGQEVGLTAAATDVLDEIAWIERELARPIVIPSANATARRERLRRERARLEALL